MDNLYLKEEAYIIIGLCMEVHKILGKGHSEIVYGDALEYELKKYTTEGLRPEYQRGISLF